MSLSLYEQDYNLWLEKTTRLILAKRFNEIEWDYLLSELGELGKSEKRALVSNLVILLAHLLKLKVQFDAPESMKISWYNSGVEHRTKVSLALKSIPSLKSYLLDAINNAYPEARKIAIDEGKRAKFGVKVKPKSEYPEECPFTLEMIMDEEFYG